MMGQKALMTMQLTKAHKSRTNLLINKKYYLNFIFSPTLCVLYYLLYRSLQKLKKISSHTGGFTHKHSKELWLSVWFAIDKQFSESE